MYFNFLIQIDLSKPWIDQGPVDVLIHKVTDFIAAAENGDLQAFKAVQKIEVGYCITLTFYSV